MANSLLLEDNIKVLFKPLKPKSEDAKDMIMEIVVLCGILEPIF